LIAAGLALWLAASSSPSSSDTGAPAAAAGREAELKPSEVHFLDGAFQLKLNTGWFTTRPAGDDVAAGAAASAAPAFAGDFDLRQRRARISLGGGDERRLRLRVEWDVALDDDMARVQSKIDVAIFGQAFKLAAPDIRVRPTFDHGEPGFELNVPLVEGRF
jgi:hypothetical protein